MNVSNFQPFLMKCSAVFKVALVSVLAWQFSALIWNLSSPDHNLQLSNQKLEQWMVLAAKPLVPDDRFLPNRMFAKTVVKQEKSRPVVAPKTALNMILKAVFVAPDASQSGAIIAAHGKTTQYFKIGGEIDRGITLVGVQADHVVIERNGQRESLFFPKKDSIARGNIASTSNFNAKNSNTKQLGSKRPTYRSSTKNNLKSLPKTDLANDIKRLTPQAFMSKYQEKLEENPEQVLSEAGITVAPSGAGYRIGQSPYSSLLTSAGLKVGDVVLSVNGQVLGNTSQDAQLMGSLANQKEVEVEIQRGSRQMMVSFPIGRR